MKKTAITILSMVLLISLGANSTSAQDKSTDKNSKYKMVKIKTSSQCGMCKDRIEEAMAFEKGVKSSELDLDTKILTVIYKPKKTDPDKIRKAIAKVGYDADDVPADEKAYSKLPGCCKKPDDPDHEPHG